MNTKFNAVDAVEMRGGQSGEVTLKLSLKGLYTWSIKLPLQPDGSGGGEVLKELTKIDAQLKTLFPNHPERQRTRTVNF